MVSGLTATCKDVSDGPDWTQTPRGRYRFHVMNKPSQPADPGVPTPEQLAGRHLRLLRLQRGWSQQDVMERMRPYGYQWSHATVTRLEAATRPLRLNELADLALVFEVPLRELLGLGEPSPERDDPDAVERELSQLARTHVELQQRLSHAHSFALGLQEKAAEAQYEEATAAAGLMRTDGRLEVLMRWHPRYKHLRLEEAIKALTEENDSAGEGAGKP